MHDLLAEIRTYAKKQLLSWETLETLVMLGLLLFLVLAVIPRAEGRGRIVSGLLLLVFAGITAFGLYETLPALVRFLNPLQAGFLRQYGTAEERLAFVKAVDADLGTQRELDNHDLSAGERYLVLHGTRNIEAVEKAKIRRANLRYYPHRKPYRGLYFLDLETADGRKHTLDFHMGKLYNPERRTKEISEYLENGMHIQVTKERLTLGGNRK